MKKKEYNILTTAVIAAFAFGVVYLTLYFGC